MGFSSLGGKNDGEFSGVDFVEIFGIFVMQDEVAIIFGSLLLDRVLKMKRSRSDHGARVLSHDDDILSGRKGCGRNLVSPTAPSVSLTGQDIHVDSADLRSLSHVFTRRSIDAYIKIRSIPMTF